MLHTRDSTRYKQFHKGLAQLEEEGAIQIFIAEDGLRREPIVAAVGELQVDVVQARLTMEYGVETTRERLGLASVRWIEGESQALAATRWPPRSTLRARDRDGRLVALFASEWDRQRCETENPAIAFVVLE